jgi:two-component system chemotaxis sensor kinase CheA
MDDLLADFLTETSESLGDLDVALLKLEQNPNDKDTLGLIFRLVHTIKGTCGFLGLSRLEHVAHAAENVLGRVRDGLQVVTPGLITLILKATDRFKEIVNGIAETGTEPTGDDSALVTDLNLLAAGGAATEPAAAHAPDIDALDLMADPTPAPTAEEEAPAPAEAAAPAPPPVAPPAPPPAAKPAHAEEAAAPAAEPTARRT